MIKINKSMYEYLLESNPKLVTRTKDGYYLLGKEKKAKAKRLKNLES